MPSVEEQIKKLNDELLECEKQLDKFGEVIIKLKNKSSLDQKKISNKEKELEQVRTQLLTITTERDDIRGQIGKKIDELNVSNLSKEEKTEQISNLMTGEYQKLKGACQKLTKTWTDFNKVKDSLNELEKALSNSRLKAIQSLEKTKKRQWIVISVLLVVVILLSLSLLLLSASINKKKKKKQGKETLEGSPNNWGSNFTY